MAETNFPFMCFHSDLIRCLSQDDGMERFDKIVDKIEDTLYDPLSARNHTCSDFNSQPKEWLSHLNKTDEGRYWHDFIIYELPQIANHLDLFLTSDPEKILHRSVTSLGHSRPFTDQFWCHAKGIPWCPISLDNILVFQNWLG